MPIAIDSKLFSHIVVHLQLALIISNRHVNSAWGLSCYFCIGSSNYMHGCNDPLNRDDTAIMKCEGEACHTIKMKGGAVRRTCIYKVAAMEAAEGCKEFPDVNFCWCNSELCNDQDINQIFIGPPISRKDLIFFKTYVSKYLDYIVPEDFILQP